MKLLRSRFFIPTDCPIQVFWRKPKVKDCPYPGLNACAMIDLDQRWITIPKKKSNCLRKGKSNQICTCLLGRRELHTARRGTERIEHDLPLQRGVGRSGHRSQTGSCPSQTADVCWELWIILREVVPMEKSKRCVRRKKWHLINFCGGVAIIQWHQSRGPHALWTASFDRATQHSGWQFSCQITLNASQKARILYFL